MKTHIVQIFAAAMLVLFTWAQARALRDARDDLNAARQTLQGYVEAAKIEHLYRQHEAERRAEAAALDEDLKKGGTDAPMSDYLRGAAGRLWPE